MMYRLRTINKVMSEMPFEVLITLMCLFSGLPMALGILPSPSSVLSTLPVWAIRCWGVMLSVGGLTTIIGLLMSHATRNRKFVEGLYIEGGGMLILGSGALVFGLTIMAAAGMRSIFSVCVYLALTASCFFRFRTAKQTVRKMKEAIDLERKRIHGD